MAHSVKRRLASGKFVWEAKWRRADGTSDSKRPFPTKRAADAYGVKQEEAKLRGVEFDPKAGGTTFRTYAQKWLDSRQDLKATAVRGYRDALAPNNGRKRHHRLRHLRIDDVFGGYPLNRITRDYVQDWVNRMVAAGRAPSTVRNAYFIVHQVMAQAYVDGLVGINPAQRGYIKLPTNHSTGRRATVDDPSQFLSAAQVDALVAATPWPFCIEVHLAAWAGLRAAELHGLQIGDVRVPEASIHESRPPSRPGVLHVERTVQSLDGKLTYLTPKTRGSCRKVPLTAQTTELLREYLAEHPRRQEPTAPLFPGVQLIPNKPTGKRAPGIESGSRAKALRQASALAALTVWDAEARLDLDWSQPVRHHTFYKAVYRPAILRASRMSPTAALPEGLVFHGLRHTYASLCVAAGIPPMEISRFMGHANPSITLGIYAHLLEDDHEPAMTALGSLSRPVARAGNVIPLRS
ncbi:tyrosine-type recombinase/integrase [Mycolicibacterium stellerae]|uniref:tyrosine-type recombinase/integrase n=1 Tax=Mycolicibacterium stellerae TaxID=2358193 RepID=UPI000F0BABF1|nr:site-specific integrase [Mycolicibacterium stellerae]